jgi:hypothetical protein
MGDMQTTTNTDTTIDRYLESWNEPDAEARSAQAQAIWADDGRLVAPLVDVVTLVDDRIQTAIGFFGDLA